MIAYSSPDGTPGAVTRDDRTSEDGTPTLRPLPADAQHALDQIADALGVATALMRPHGDGRIPGDDVRLVEASELLQAFFRIHDPAVRQRCVAYVRQASDPVRAL